MPFLPPDQIAAGADSFASFMKVILADPKTFAARVAELKEYAERASTALSDLRAEQAEAKANYLASESAKKAALEKIAAAKAEIEPRTVELDQREAAISAREQSARASEARIASLDEEIADRAAKLADINKRLAEIRSAA
jgi:uncharacterized protein (DUF3084 family)